METTLKTQPFQQHTKDYEAWFEKYPFVFQSELQAFRELIPENSSGVEIGIGTGRYAIPLGIKEGIEPADNMRKLAMERGLEVMDAVAEKLPYKDMHFDFVLMVTVNHFENIKAALSEAHRVLKRGGSLIIGFIDKDRPIAKAYEAKRAKSVFYKHATFYSVWQVKDALREAGFKEMHFTQTLFHSLNDVKEVEPVKEGYGEGSFVVVKAVKSH